MIILTLGDKMKFQIICILVIVSLSIVSIAKADEFSCELNDGSGLVEYYCVNFKGVIPEDCSSASHRNTIHKKLIPTQAIHDIERLKIGGCDISLVLNTIRRYPNVRSIDISYSGFESLDWFDLKLEQLEKFNASHNEISQIPAGLFDNMPNLIEVDLSHNSFDKGKLNSFDGAAKLQQINLSHNNLTSIDRDTFANLTNLKYVDLSNNLFDGVYGVFQNNTGVKVNLLNTPISMFDCYTFDKGLSAQLSLDNLESLLTRCADHKYHVIRNSQKSGIFSVSPGIYEIHCSDQSLKKLTMFKTAYNTIDNLSELLECFGPSIRTVHINDNDVGMFNSTILDRFPDLRWLTLHNASLSEFDFGILKYPMKLETLQLSYNNLKRFKNVSLLRNLERLQTFKAAENQLENVPEILEYLPESVDALDLSGSYVGLLNSTTFERFRNLNRLRLDNTSLHFSDVDPFEKLDHLYFLGLSHNNLAKMDFNVLSKTLNRLDKLMAINCQIKNISEVIQYLGSSIRVLNLAENSVGESKGESSGIDGNAFQHQIALTSLNISYNHLRELDLRSAPTGLRSIFMAGNDLREISNFNRQRFPKLWSLSMSKNQFSCEYLTQFMKDWEGIRFIDDPWDQKHGDDCQSKNLNGTVIITS